MNNILWFPKLPIWWKWCLIEISQWLSDLRRQMMIALDKCILPSWMWLSFELDFKLSIGLCSVCQAQRAAGPRCGESCCKDRGQCQAQLLPSRALGVRGFGGSTGTLLSRVCRSCKHSSAAPGCHLGWEGCPWPVSVLRAQERMGDWRSSLVCGL